jgi:hypothetical protein
MSRGNAGYPGTFSEKVSTGINGCVLLLQMVNCPYMNILGDSPELLTLCLSILNAFAFICVTLGHGRKRKFFAKNPVLEFLAGRVF